MWPTAEATIRHVPITVSILSIKQLCKSFDAAQLFQCEDISVDTAVEGWGESAYSENKTLRAKNRRKRRVWGEMRVKVEPQVIEKTTTITEVVVMFRKPRQCPMGSCQTAY